MIRSLLLWKIVFLAQIGCLSSYAQVGDIDGDGVPTVRDIALIVEHVKGAAPLDAVRTSLADINKDGTVTQADVEALIVEVMQTQEPEEGVTLLDGFMLETGVVASVPTSAPALDVAAARDLAVTANGENGVTLFKLVNGQYPSRVAEIDTPGKAVAVAMSGDYIAVADDYAGLAIVDMTDLGAIRIRHQLRFDFPVITVATCGSLSFASTADGKLYVIDLPSGANLGQVSLFGSGAVQDLAVSGDVLYALQVGLLSAVQWSPTLKVTGIVSAPGVTGSGDHRLRVSAGTGTVYATHRKGYHLFDTSSNPRLPKLLEPFETDQSGWKQFVPNGSGLGVAVVGSGSASNGSDHLDLYDVGEDGRESTYLTTLETPGVAVAAVVYKGLAYVADSSEGLQVVNYLPYDVHGVPPTIELSSNYNLQPGSADEGSLMRLTAEIFDDVQVRYVEFYVDDGLVGTDGSYPFESRFLTPAMSATKTSFTVRSRATDTGGNSAWSATWNLDLTPDTTPPAVISFRPGMGAIETEVTTVSVQFNESIDRPTLLSGLSLKYAGADNTWGTLDDAPVASGALRYGIESYVATLAFSSLLPSGRYQINASAPISDVAGNGLSESKISEFIVPGVADLDEDGIPDDYEPLLGLNPTKADSDNNGIIDGDEDFDDDGLSNHAELVLGLLPSVADSNGNGIKDGAENRDFDDLTEREEWLAGTDPLKWDTDGDGLDDAGELADGSDPLSSASVPLMHAHASQVSYLNAVMEKPNVSEIPVVAQPASYLNAIGDEFGTQTTVIYSSEVSYENE